MPEIRKTLEGVVNKEFSFQLTKKSFDKDYVRNLCASRGIDFEDGYEERVVEGIISTEAVDRQGDVILAEGIDFTDFRTNPVIFFNHDSHSIPVAASILEEVFQMDGRKGIKATVIFHEVTEMANALCKLYRDGWMKGFSVGLSMKPGSAKRPSSEERRRYGMGDNGFLVTSSSLLEFSAVGIPANQEALTIAKGLLTQTERVALLGEQPEEETQELEMKISEEELRAIIKSAAKEEAEKLVLEKSGAKYSRATKESFRAAWRALKPIMDEIGEEDEDEEEETSKSMSSLLDSIRKHTKSITSPEEE